MYKKKRNERKNWGENKIQKERIRRSREREKKKAVDR